MARAVLIGRFKSSPPCAVRLFLPHLPEPRGRGPGRAAFHLDDHIAFCDWKGCGFGTTKSTDVRLAESYVGRSDFMRAFGTSRCFTYPVTGWSLFPESHETKGNSSDKSNLAGIFGDHEDANVIALGISGKQKKAESLRAISLCSPDNLFSIDESHFDFPAVHG